MTSPRRRPLHRDPLDIESTLKRAVTAAPEVELGWSLLRQEMRDAGWPARTPEDDRRPSTGNGDDSDVEVPSVWLCACGHTFETEAQATTHRDLGGHDWCRSVTTGHASSGIDYGDPAGDLALRLNHLADDLDLLEEHWHLVCTSLRAMALIARKHLPPGPLAVPACSVSTCDGHVEMTPGGGYRGMERIAGMWVAKPGIRPLCARHRLGVFRGGLYHDGFVA